MPGKSLVTIEIDESIYKDKRFVDGKKVIRMVGEWPIVFRRRTYDDHGAGEGCVIRMRTVWGTGAAAIRFGLGKPYRL